MQLVLGEKKKKENPKCNRKKSSMLHQERKKKKNPTHKKYEHLAPSVPNNKRRVSLLILHVHIFLNIQFLNVVFTDPAMHY